MSVRIGEKRADSYIYENEMGANCFTVRLLFKTLDLLAWMRIAGRLRTEKVNKAR